jgi:hypothetical protein
MIAKENYKQIICTIDKMIYYIHGKASSFFLFLFFERHGKAFSIR